MNLSPLIARPRFLPLLCVFVLGTMSIASTVLAQETKAGVIEVDLARGDKDHERLAAEMTRTLRSVIRGQRRLNDVGKLSATLTDARDAFGCNPADLDCMRNLAQTLGVNVLFWGLISGGGDQARLLLWGVTSEGNQKHVSVQIRRQRPFLDYRAIAKTLVEALVTPEQTLSKVRISTLPDGAFVRINGDTVGISPVEVSLRPGRYDAELSSDGHDLTEVRFEVKDQASQSFEWALKQNVELSTSIFGTDDQRNIIRWSALTVAVATLATSAYYRYAGDSLADETNKRVKCNRGKSPGPNACAYEGGPIQYISEEDYLSAAQKISDYSARQIVSGVLSGVATSMFAATFIF